MNAATGTQDFVRQVSSTDGLDILQPLPGLNGTIDELLAFADSLRAEGLDLGPRIEKISAIWTAAQHALEFDLPRAVAAIDIDTIELDEIQGIVSQAAIVYTLHLRTSFHDAAQDSGIQRVLSEFSRALFKAAGETLRSDADDLVKALRKDFDKAVKVLKTAHKHDVSKKTQRDDLLLSGSDAEIAAYRALPDAVNHLDRIAQLRLGMVRRIAYTPQSSIDMPDVACFVTGVKNELELASAENAWDGEHEHVQINIEHNASHVVQTRRPRLGGAWLQLLHAGHSLRLNTASEAGEVARADRVKVS